MPASTLKTFITATVAGCLVAFALPSMASGDKTTPLTVDASFDAAAAAAKGFTIADNKALKGIKRVAVPVFAVEFVVADNVSSTTSGFAAAGRATSSLYYKLLGVGEADFQVITDALHQQFLGDLKASGVEVLDTAQVMAAPTYRKLLATGSPAPIKTDSTLMMSPPGLGIYGFARTGGGNSAKSKSVFGALSDMGAGFAAVGAITDTIQLGTELDASLIEVRMRVSFVQLNDDSKGFFGRLSSTAATSGRSCGFTCTLIWRALSITALTASLATVATSSGRCASSQRSTCCASCTAVLAIAVAICLSSAVNWASKASSNAPICDVACWAKLCLKFSSATRPSR